MKMKVITVLGARPQFIKAAALSRVFLTNFKNKIDEKIIHTGQHYDSNLSDNFFKELNIPRPKYNLNIRSNFHGEMTGKMIIDIEKILLNEKPDYLIVYGDTNSTLAGAIAASKINIPIAHIEAGLRSFNQYMPEEINRVITDNLSSILFCPTKKSIENLSKENIKKHVYNVGDVMFDVAKHQQKKINKFDNLINSLNISNDFILVTCHRAENTDNLLNLKNILSSLNQLSRISTIVFPIHPRTMNAINKNNLKGFIKNIKILDPLSYSEISELIKNAKCVLTDSGGMQKECFFYGTPCITLRHETEWVETLDTGMNILVGSSKNKILKETKKFLGQKVKTKSRLKPYGNGDASSKIATKLYNIWFNQIK
jgi:UDP-GlcNAc3NAcA epimerase